MADGSVRHREFAEQGKDFTGLKFGTITPTDLDLSVDFGGKLFVFGEAKFGDAALPVGQRLNLERICDAITRGGGTAIGMVLSHHAPPDQQIPFADTTVRAYYGDGQWWDRPAFTRCNSFMAFAQSLALG